MKYRGGCAAPQLLRLNGCRWPERRVFGHFSGPSRQASLLSPVPATGFDPRLTNVCVVYMNVVGTIDSAAPLLSPHTYMHTCTNIHHGRLINLSCTHPTRYLIPMSDRKLDYLDFPTTRVRTSRRLFIWKIAVNEKNVDFICDFLSINYFKTTDFVIRHTYKPIIYDRLLSFIAFLLQSHGVPFVFIIFRPSSRRMRKDDVLCGHIFYSRELCSKSL